MAATESSGQVVVCDAGPLIHLDELDCLRLLSDFPRVLVPLAVWNEVARHRPTALTCPEIAFERIGCRAPLGADLVELTRRLTLHAGELEALQLARESAANFLLTDDTAARLTARLLSIPVHGTIGILVRAIRRGQRTAAGVTMTLRSLQQRSTLLISTSLLHEIIRQIDPGS